MGSSKGDVERFFDRSPDLLAIADRRGYFTCLNPEWEAVLGWSRDELMAEPYLNFVHPEDLERTCQEIARATDATPCTTHYENRLRTRDGVWRWLLWSARWDGSEWSTVAKDITTRKELERHSLHDALTGVANRALATDRLSAAIARLGRSAGAAVALLVDIDDLTTINDTHGHVGGDLVLRAIADRLTERLRAADTVGRFGGDRFLVVAEGLADGGAHGIEAVIERVHGAFSRPIPTRNGLVTVTGSVGVAVARAPGVDAEDLIRDADVALRRAKGQGRRGHAEVFDAALAEEVRRRLELAAQLRGALQRRELRVVFQPLVAMVDGMPIACEALLRWDHPDRGELLPGAFLRIAEDDGLIVPIGAWVLEESCRQLAAWRAQGRDLWVSVNVSARQLAQIDFVAVVERALRESGVPASAICLEVTETAVLRRPDVARQALDALRTLGVRVALDDFGLGYSSLTHLKALPVDVVKIDRSFVADLVASTEDRAVVEAVLTLARRMGLTVIAEGVETTDQDELLREMGCPVVQGYLYGRPVPPVDVLLPAAVLPAAAATDERDAQPASSAA
ncbi:putative bifunctional diguanylate cyclase/phosphodiesterase [Baekduia sp.]|jgi:diguanylate cyclase (GGDEF)-like protein/PAS domain S-box-containing protein|uniref:putative bifunctional diguanylate cyclase/phosphodiesterase n=1 Tax=Baekduia sp. TaxID=2600305 RepID=UPI002E02C865|nr:EAL domain-containing protein [Baekduia sp.]